MTAAGGISRVFAALRSALYLRFASLPSRIIISVFAAALVTGLTVAGLTTRSTESFLLRKIDERFPELLRTTSERLGIWYDQRELDLQTFAASEIVADSLAAKHRSLRAREEARRYLSYVQERFPQYRALFVLDSQGRLHVSAGAELELDESLRARLAAVEKAGIGAVQGAGAERYQLISAPVLRGDRRLGSLHAVVGLEAVKAILGANPLDAATGVYIVGGDAAVVTAGTGSPERASYERALPEPGAAPVVSDYRVPGGAHVVGCATRFSRFGWTLVVEQDYQVAFAPVVGVIRQVFATNVGIVVVFGLIALLIARSIVQPIRALSDGARRIAQGETDLDIPLLHGQDEIGVLSRSLHAMLDRLHSNELELERRRVEVERANADLTRANEELRRGNEMLEQLSFTDGLTRLHNHRYFQDRLREEARRADRSGEPLALILVDIDDFKLLNDRHGHATGDAVLRSIAVLLNNTVRESDLPARYGGEEFVVLAPGTGAKGALTLAEKLRRVIGRTRLRAGSGPSEGLSVTVSVGAAIYRGDSRRLFNEADQALYRAKDSGKDCVVLHEGP